MAKRGDNIRKRKDGRWEGRYKKGCAVDGCIIYGSVYGKTYKEVKEKMAAIISHPLQLATPKGQGKTFGEVLNLWMDNNRVRLKGGTINKYQNLIDTHIMPELGQTKINELSATRINTFLNEKISRGRVDGSGGLSASYVRSIMLVINAAIKYAVSEQLCSPLKTPICKPPADKTELSILSAEEQKKQAQEAIESFRKVCPDPVFAVGECANADPFELSLALVKYGFKVAEIYGTITGENFIYIRQLKKLSPQTKIFSNMEPTMLYYDPTESGVTLTIGKDACYYHPNTKGIHWNEERQPFGYAGVRRLFEALELAVTKQAEGNVLQKQVEVIGSKSQEAIAEQSQEALFKEEVDKKEDVYVRGLWKGLTPFAPDQSGAASVFYELGGILVICDAGGCTGNVCGFDEPRWFGERSAIFSAGLRDMDAILGRDDRLVAKLTDAAEKIDANFAAVIGTPVPAVIATDYRALQRMCEKKTNFPILTVDTNGMELYDVGEEKAWLTLFKTFAGKDVASQKEASEEDDSSKKMKIGVLGLTPHDVSDLHVEEKFRKLENENTHYICYGMGAGIDKVKTAGSVEKNLVVAPAALETAKYLEKEFGTPYEVGYPFVDELIPELDYERKKILIIHQQVIANAIRQEIRIRSDEQQNTEVTVASWFMMKSEFSEEGDLSLKEEKDYCKLVQNGNYDIVFADENMRGLVPGFKGTFVNVRHFAVSGKLQES
jgi:hypothetical protein